MTFVSEIAYVNEAGKHEVTDEVATFRMDALSVTFSCPICGDEQTHETRASPPPNEKHLCSNCRNDYSLLSVRGKDTSQSELEERVEEQLTAVEMFHDIALENPDAVRELAYAPTYVATSLVGVVLGTSANILLLIASFLFLPKTMFFWVLIISIVTQTALASTGGLFGPFRFAYNGFKLYRQYDPDVSFRTFVEYAGHYNNKDIYQFET